MISNNNEPDLKFSDSLKNLIENYNNLVKELIKENIGENHIDLSSYDKIKSIKDKFESFNHHYNEDDKLENILAVWGSGQNENFDFLSIEKQKQYPKLINSVSNKNRLSVCLKKKSEDGLFELADRIYRAIKEIKITDGITWESVIVEGNIELKDSGELRNNNIQAFIKELYYCINIEEDKYPLWNGCTKNALTYLNEIEKIDSKFSKIDLIRRIYDHIIEKQDYKKFYLVDKFFNVIDKISESDLQIDDDKTGIKEFYKNVWSYLMGSKTWRARRLKSNSELMSLLSKDEGTNIVLYGPPGTSKTYGAEETIKEIIRIEFEQKDSEDEKKDLVDEIIKEYESRVSLIQFHASYDYEDFIEGYKIRPTEDKKNIYFEKIPGHFKSFIDKVVKDKDENKKYYFIIDEINRADLSKVLGELIYCMEKRGNQMKLRYSPNEDFWIPKNVFIIGTMNTTDKSVEAFDIALRRRFIWLHRDYDEEVLKSMIMDAGIKLDDPKAGELIAFAKKLNDKITAYINLGENYKIGQAIFQKAIEGNKINIKDLENYHLKPLLKEYLRFSIENESELNKAVDSFIKQSKK